MILLNSQFTPLMLSSIINLHDLKFNGIKFETISAYFSIVVLIATIGSVVAIFIRVNKLASNMNNESIQEFNERFSELTSDLRETTSDQLVIFWKPLNLIRLFLTLIVLTTLINYPVLQMQVLLIFSIV